MKKKNILLKIVLLLFLSTTANVFAEPSRAIKYLMTEETSLFDRGMDKLDSVFDGMEITPVGYLLTSVRYDWDENRIIISSTLSPNSRDAKNKSEAEGWCRLTIERIKLILGISGSSGMPLHEYSYLNQYFSHYGYMNNKKQGGPGKELDRIAEVKASIRYEDKKTLDSYASCKGKLTDSKIQFTEK